MKPILLVGMFALTVTATFAHSGFDTTTPQNGAVLAEAPPHIVLTFTKATRLTRVRLTHDEHSAVDLDLGDLKTFTTRFVVPVANMGSGLYRIEWRGLAGDGHVMRGLFTFRVK